MPSAIGDPGERRVHPYLIELGKIRVPAYGVFVTIGFLLALLLATRRAASEGVDPKDVQDLAFWMLVGGIAGARFYYVVQHWAYFSKNPLEVLYLWRGGLAIIGGIVAGALAGVAFCRKRRLPVLRMFDLVAWVLPLAQAVGRLGCLFAGCCYGKPCHLPWAIVFKDPHSLGPIGVPLHPTEVYHMLANLMVFGALTLRYKRRAFEGEILSLYLVFYSAGRFLVEFFRGDDRGFWGPLSIPQWLCLLLFVSGLLLYWRLRRSGDA